MLPRLGRGGNTTERLAGLEWKQSSYLGIELNQGDFECLLEGLVGGRHNFKGLLDSKSKMCYVTTTGAVSVEDSNIST